MEFWFIEKQSLAKEVLRGDEDFRRINSQGSFRLGLLLENSIYGLLMAAKGHDVL